MEEYDKNLGLSTPDYGWQLEAVEAIRGAYEQGRQSCVVSAFMGAGKSRVIAKTAELLHDHGLQVIVTAPTRIIVDQLRQVCPETTTVTTNNSFGKVLRKLVEAYGPEGVAWIADEVHRTEADAHFKQALLGAGVVKNPWVHIKKDGALQPPGDAHVVFGDGGQIIGYNISIDDDPEHDEFISLDELPKYTVERLELSLGFSLGFTATAFRAVKKQRLSLWKDVIYQFDMEQAIAAGVVVPLRVVSTTTVDDIGVEIGVETEWTIRPEDIPDYPDPKMPRDEALQFADSLVETVLEIARDDSLQGGAVNAISIKDAGWIQQVLGAYGVAVGVVHSRQKKAVNDQVLEDHKKGKIDVVVYVSMLSEGADMPWLRWILLRRRTGSRVRLIQEVGRVMRAFPGKTEGVVYDPWGLVNDIGLEHEIALGPYEVRKGISTTNDAQRQVPTFRSTRIYTHRRDLIPLRLALVLRNFLKLEWIPPDIKEADGVKIHQVIQQRACRPVTDKQLRYLWVLAKKAPEEMRGGLLLAYLRGLYKHQRQPVVSTWGARMLIQVLLTINRPEIMNLMRRDQHDIIGAMNTTTPTRHLQGESPWTLRLRDGTQTLGDNDQILAFLRTIQPVDDWVAMKVVARRGDPWGTVTWSYDGLVRSERVSFAPGDTWTDKVVGAAREILQHPEITRVYVADMGRKKWLRTAWLPGLEVVNQKDEVGPEILQALQEVGAAGWSKR